MKYFTPELYVALQQCNTPAAFREVNARWERAVQQYHSRLTELQCANHQRPSEGQRVIRALHRLINLGSLHDAEVRELGMTDGRRLVLVLREENRVGTLLLTYSLVNDPLIHHALIPPEHRSVPRIWLYDELERVAGASHTITHAGRESEFPVYCHSILLSDGIELVLKFYRIEVVEIHPLLERDPVALPREEYMDNIS